MEPAFTHAEVFPVIARLVRALSGSKCCWVTHAELVAALMADADGRRLIDGAMAFATEGNKAAEWWAGNMIAWFSQRIKIGVSDYADDFELEMRPDGYAYRPA